MKTINNNNEILVVTGATGNIGKKVAERLLLEGRTVRVVGRDAKKLESLARQGAEVAVGSLEDVAFVTKTLTGATAVFAMIPPNYAAPDQRKAQAAIGETLAAAIQKSGIQFVVSLSSVGAQHAEKVGPIKGLFDQEQRLNKITSANVIHLRPAFFMENLLHQLPLVQNMGITGSPLIVDRAISMIATRDIADEVARLLVSRDFSGKSVRELLGPQDLSMKEVTTALAERLNKPALNYVQFPYEAAAKAMVESGMSEDAARQMNEMYTAFNEGLPMSTQGRSSKTTTPTTLGVFLTTVI